MKDALRTLLSRFKFKLKFNSTVYIAGNQNCFDILDDVTQFSAPYNRKMQQAGDSHGFFRGFACHEIQDIDYNQLVSEHDLNHSIPDMVKQATATFLASHSGNINLSIFIQHIYKTLFDNYFGLSLTGGLVNDCQILYTWLFESGTLDFDSLAHEQQQAIIIADISLKSKIRQSIEDNASVNDNNLTVLERIIKLQKKYTLSDEITVELFAGLLLGVCSTLKPGFAKLFTLLHSNNRATNTLYQAASANNGQKMQYIINDLNIMAGSPLMRMASTNTILNRTLLPNIKISQDDHIVILSSLKKMQADNLPESLISTPENLAANYIEYGYGPHTTFGKTLSLKIIATSFAKIFSSHRIKDITTTNIEIAMLPTNPQEYKFEIFGSSPPWAVGEEMAWLLDSCGIKNHIQVNILSLYEFPRLLIKRKLTFKDTKIFYSAYDKKHNILFGSPYGEADATIEMGNQFHSFLSPLGMDRLLPARHFSKDENFDKVFGAYTNIRNNYYTWAYFSAFLDKGYGFVYQALLIFTKKPGFKPLTIFGNISLTLVVGLVALLQVIPFVNTKLNGFFANTVAKNLIILREAIEILNTVLADGRPYIFGDTFSAADIHICANLGNLIIPEQFQRGGYYPPLDDYPPTYRKNIEEFRNTRLGEYVLRVYREHRM